MAVLNSDFQTGGSYGIPPGTTTYSDTYDSDWYKYTYADTTNTYTAPVLTKAPPAVQASDSSPNPYLFPAKTIQTQPNIKPGRRLHSPFLQRVRKTPERSCRAFMTRFR